MRNILSNTENQIQSWFYYSNLGLFTCFISIGIVLSLLVGISVIPMVLTLLYINNWWMILVFPLTIGLTGFLTFFGGVSFIQWTSGESKIFNK